MLGSRKCKQVSQFTAGPEHSSSESLSQVAQSSRENDDGTGGSSLSSLLAVPCPDKGVVYPIGAEGSPEEVHCTANL